jgi:hypothetical protein
LIIYGHGDLVHKTIEAEILKLDKELRSLKRIEIAILEKIIMNLLDINKRTIDQISEAIIETREDVKVDLRYLISCVTLSELFL